MYTATASWRQSQTLRRERANHHAMHAATSLHGCSYKPLNGGDLNCALELILWATFISPKDASWPITTSVLSQLWHDDSPKPAAHHTSGMEPDVCVCVCVRVCVCVNLQGVYVSGVLR